MRDVAALLPSNSEPFEYALAGGMSDDLAVPFADLMDPYKTEARLLPYLAAHHSVDLWYDDWSEQRKREMIAQCAGRSVLYPGSRLAALKGTLVGLKRYLAFVDADIIDRIAHPARFTFGRAVIGRTPIAHQPFTAHYLVHVTLRAPKNHFQIGRSAFGRAALTSVDLEPIRRAQRAMVTAKTPDTLYTVSFAWRRPITLQDAVMIDGSTSPGGYRQRQFL
ncbi:phage tail protein I [Agrobacterium tumefaciens]|uniref:Phage tail protein I n=1 Tax=Agrobacterium tumefaciens TaxID=358 RepID=A0AAP9J872_AGRTU|nr:phage tail protein I [Agrobacterium tumefaciens]NSZ59567.1 phage tail protein I [Agrobacterium tumefaciens]QDY96019.1 phage tail protein I [Agrobacterium tumefaciens]UXS46262.1 phage tail protein I [Agrobacterium tumefaciens]UXS73156.1 phage tail protein I [Agrobacterium tumefaciens]UXS80009.1 phage tail protein I [Agrobacterium tumefaciens]